MVSRGLLLHTDNKNRVSAEVKREVFASFEFLKQRLGVSNGRHADGARFQKKETHSHCAAEISKAQVKGRKLPIVSKVFSKKLLDKAFVFEFNDENLFAVFMQEKSEAKTKLYFIALIPPAPIYDEALEQKLYFKDNYNSKASLNSPPHITLHMPFRWKEQKESELANRLGNFIKAFDPIKVCLDNYSSFPPRVIFINVVKTEPLENLQRGIQRFCKKELNLFNANYKEQPFLPHLTLAFRDLKKPNYKKAWDEFESREYKAEFIADRIALLKHTGRVWQVYKEFNLESSYTLDSQSKLAATEG
jgi:2'-5' RNA ligase